MRVGWVISGLVLLVLGALIMVGGLALNQPHTSAQSVPAGSAWGFTPSELTQQTATVRWTGGVGATQVYLVYAPGGPPPFGFPCGGGGQVVTLGVGQMGSMSAAVNPGDLYLVYGCNGSKPESLAFNITLSGGVTLVEVLGIPPLIVGGVLLAIGFRSYTAPLEEVERILGPPNRSGPP